MNKPTTTRFTPNVIAAVSVAAVGMSIRGNRIRRRRDSRWARDTIPWVVASAKNEKKTMPMRSETP
jgi:hypothetical protein